MRVRPTFSFTHHSQDLARRAAVPDRVTVSVSLIGAHRPTTILSERDLAGIYAYLRTIPASRAPDDIRLLNAVTREPK